MKRKRKDSNEKVEYQPDAKKAKSDSWKKLKVSLDKMETCINNLKEATRKEHSPLKEKQVRAVYKVETCITKLRGALCKEYGSFEKNHVDDDDDEQDLSELLTQPPTSFPVLTVCKEYGSFEKNHVDEQDLSELLTQPPTSFSVLTTTGCKDPPLTIIPKPQKIIPKIIPKIVSVRHVGIVVSEGEEEEKNRLDEQMNDVTEQDSGFENCCVDCGVSMGSMNGRQLCRKTYCENKV